jgi:hypothetical protein
MDWLGKAAIDHQRTGSALIWVGEVPPVLGEVPPYSGKAEINELIGADFTVVPRRNARRLGIGSIADPAGRGLVRGMGSLLLLIVRPANERPAAVEAAHEGVPIPAPWIVPG